MYLKGLQTLFLIMFPLALLSQKTDLVILNNGDQITGEIKKLELDILQLKTSAMSTVQIKWFEVKNIYAPNKYVQVELKDKTLIFGSLDSINVPNALKIKSEIGEFNIPTDQVVSIFQVKQVFWNRFSGSLSAGISFTKGSQVLQSNYGTNITYTDRYRLAALDISSIRTEQPERETTAKEDYYLSFNRTVLPRQFATIFAGAQRNTELGIDLRTIAGLGYGVDLLHNTIARVRFTSNAIANQETALEDQNRTYNAEGLFALDARIFKYTDPEVYLTATLNYYPSITVPGRHRLEADVKLRFEIINNLFLEFKVYDNYDSKPVSETAQYNDYGFISGLQFTFGL